jgi:hypothetical protein
MIADISTIRLDKTRLEFLDELTRTEVRLERRIKKWQKLSLITSLTAVACAIAALLIALL